MYSDPGIREYRYCKVSHYFQTYLFILNVLVAKLCERVPVKFLLRESIDGSSMSVKRLKN